MTDDKSRRRWISLGEVIAMAALIISALGLWITWNGSQKNEPTRIVEQKQSVPLVLRATVERDGRALAIEPVESSHALQSLALTFPGATPIEVGSDGRLEASAVQAAIQDADRKGAKKVRVRIAARYVEAGTDRRSTGSYSLSYRWEGGGLFGGKSVRLTGLSR
jgi:hypothetical protein